MEPSGIAVQCSPLLAFLPLPRKNGLNQPNHRSVSVIVTLFEIVFYHSH